MSTMLMSVLMLLMTLSTSAVPVPSSSDIALFDQILAPVWKVYNFVKYAASVAAILFLVFAGVNYVMSGNDVTKRENAKHQIMYAILGLIVIWAAPFLVQLVTSI